jgi:N-hydroxyarylamine O-acetyltransferase
VDESLVERYLRRIGHEGPREPGPETLRALHRAHLAAVPFENLDIHAGRPILAEEAPILEKIVTRRRGGFCYELNGAFAALLRALGFDVTLLSARVRTAAGGFGPEFDRLALLVRLDERWLADVGFGDSFIDLLLLDEPGEQRQPAGAWRVEGKGDERALARRGADGSWETEYLFTLAPRRLSEFADMCRWHQTSPESPFTRKTVCTLPTPDGRITLSDRRLIVTAPTGREERDVDDADRPRLLRERFGVVIP